MILVISLGADLDTNGTFRGVLESEVFMLEPRKVVHAYHAPSVLRRLLTGLLMTQGSRKKVGTAVRITLGGVDVDRYHIVHFSSLMAHFECL